MSALKIKDAQGNWIEVPMIKGDKGDKGEQGDTYELTEQDKQDIADLIEVPEPLKYIKDDPSDNGGVIEGNVNGTDKYSPNIATGMYSHAEGAVTTSSGGASHAEGSSTIASGTGSHAEGGFTTASNKYSHSEGFKTIASGQYSHTEGQQTTASNWSAHAEGTSTVSSGAYSHTEGLKTIANHRSQHVFGELNIEDPSSATNNERGEYIEIIGNGNYDTNTRSNAYTLDWNGNGVYAGKLTVGTAPTADMDVATKKYVDDVKGASIHICSSAEYDSTTRIPTIENPDERTFYLVPSQDGTSPDLFVEWAYVNNAWEMFGSAKIDLSNYVTNTDYATANDGGVVRVNGYGLKINATNGIIQTSGATSGIIKSATGSDAEYRPVTPLRQHESTFYGLAKASGDSTQSASSNAVGTYTDEAKASIKNMLGVQDGMVVNATLMSDPWYSVDKTYAEIGLAVADGINVVMLSDGKVFPYAGMMYFQSVPVITFGSFFAYDGKLVSNGFIVTMDDNDATIAQKIQSETTIPTLNDVQINGTSVVSNGVANVPLATSGSNNNFGVVGIGITNGYYGIKVNDGILFIDKASDTQIKNANEQYKPIVPTAQDKATFYGLAKAAGHDEKDSTLALGQYTPEAKGAIQSMLGIDSLIAPTETNPFSEAHAIGDLFIINGALYKAKTAIAVGDVLDDGVNVDGVSVDDVAVKDVQINGTSILNDGVANIPVAKRNEGRLGVVTTNTAYGTDLTVNGLLYVYSADATLIKNGVTQYRPIVPSTQHISTFYGLAKASGDTTQSQSDNAVGTYTDDAKDSIQNMLGITPLIASHESDPFESAHVIGELFIINGKLYRAKTVLTAGEYINEGTNVEVVSVAEVVDEKLNKPEGTITTSVLLNDFTVTTAQEQDWKSPHMKATVKSRIPKNARYIVTYNGTDYELPCQLWGDNNNKVVEFLGNISLYADNTAGFNQTIYNVPFCIISDLDNASSIDVVTSNAETATFKITKVLNNTDTIDKEYLYGSADGPFKYYDSGSSTYSKLSIGNANLVTNRGGIAIGSNNKSSGDFAIAMGYGTLASGNESLSEGNCTLADGFASHAEGSQTDASGDASHAEGYKTEVTSEADYGHAEGSNTVVSGIGGHAEGYSTQAEGLFSHAEGFQTVANHFAQHVFGAFNIADSSTADSEEDGNYIEIVGNGNDSNSRSNARTLDWQGNEKLKGSITLGADTANETSLSATELQGLKAIDVSNVVRTTDIGTDTTMGIVRTNSSFGITSASGSIRTSAADSGHIKAGTHGYKPITPMRQHEAVFYGLTKAAGVDMASSSNAVGTYTDEAKTAIKQMLGVVDSYDSLVVNVTGTDPVITAQPSYRYNCGEVTTLTITPPSSGTIDFIFTSGTTPTVLDLPSTVKMPSWWIGVEANTTYEMCITDGVYCGVMSWDA